MKNNMMHQRFLYGVAGIRDGYRRERSFRTHLGLTGVGIALLFVIEPSALWCALLLCALAMSLGLELINGAIEALADHLHPQLHPAIGSLKDMASGGVLLANLGTIAVGIAMIADSSV